MGGFLLRLQASQDPEQDTFPVCPKPKNATHLPILIGLGVRVLSTQG